MPLDQTAHSSCSTAPRSQAWMGEAWAGMEKSRQREPSPCMVAGGETRFLPQELQGSWTPS